MIVLSTGFDPARATANPPADTRLTADSRSLLQDCLRDLRPGGLLFVYGLPRELAVWGNELRQAADDSGRLVFKYWIALDIAEASGLLHASHLGLLMFHKCEPGKSTALKLDLDAARVPHAYCTACGRTVKDWGGKKHLMNPRGTALSDVWRDLPRRPITDNVIPHDVLARIKLLTASAEPDLLSVVQSQPGVENRLAAASFELSPGTRAWRGLNSLRLNEIYEGDCVAFLERVKVLQPKGAFELAFADPPYNLEKKYDSYADGLAEQKYLQWCEAWLDGMAENLKPGGSLFVLNLPQWALHHAVFLNRRLEFRHWIAWDALSDPRGKLMPAHYALLWYTKPGGKPVCNRAGPDEARAKGQEADPTIPLLVAAPDAPKYCLRAACVKKRKAAGDDEKVALSDVWFDIHRIRHKRDRDAHPCQLPEKLMERIIRLASNPGDVVFDPFGGAGTTAIAALKLDRKYVVTEMDANYVRITKEKLAALQRRAAASETVIVPRRAVIRPRGSTSKKGIEIYLQELARKLDRVPTEADVEADRPEILKQMDTIYRTRSAAFKRSKIALAK